MKRCPTCNKTFTEGNLSFCIDDGTPLVPAGVEDEQTVVSPSSQAGSSSSGSQPFDNSWKTPAYQPPGSYVSPPKGKRSAWPWVLGILVVVLIGIVGLGVAAAIMIPRFLRASADRTRPSINENLGNRNDTNSNSNSSLNTNANENTTAVEDEDPSASTDSAQVLSELTDLEHEWTVANINADKKALEKILADDYVSTVDGKAQGKAEYIRNIERDTSIEKWDFEDLKVDLKGDRATLTGVVKFVVSRQEMNFRFTDKFVWRDGRWQATGSEVTQIQ